MADDCDRDRGWAHALRALKGSPDYQRFFASYSFGLVGRMLQGTAVSWIVYDMSRSATVLGLLELSIMGPGMVVSLVAGACADRFAPKRVILTTQATQVVFALALGALVASGHAQVWHLFALLAVARLGDVIEMPSQQVLMADLVGRDKLSSAVPLDVGVFNVTSALGPALAGLCLALLGHSSPFWLNAASCAPVIAVLLLMRPEWKPGCSDEGGGFKAIASVLGHVRSDRRLIGVLLLVAGFGAAGMGYDAMMSAYARDYIGTGALGFGGLVAVEAVGAALGALAVARYGERVPRGLGIVGGMLLFAAGVAASAALPRLRGDDTPFAWSVGTAGACLVAVGFGRIVFYGSSQTLVQLVAPEELRGRVMSLWTAAFSASTVAGALWMGPVAEHFGITTAFYVAAGGSAAVAVAAYAVGLRKSGIDPAANEATVLAVEAGA